MLGFKYRIEKDIDEMLITFMDSFSKVNNTIDVLNTSIEVLYTKYKNVITVPYLIANVSYRLEVLYPIDKCIIAVLGASSKKYYVSMVSDYILVNRNHIKNVVYNTIDYLYDLDNPTIEIVSFTESLLSHFTKEYLRDSISYNKFYDNLFSVIIIECSDMCSVVDIIVSRLNKVEKNMIELALINKLDLVSLQEIVVNNLDLKSCISLEDNYYKCSEFEEKILSVTSKITDNIIDVVFDIINKYAERHLDNPNNKLAQNVMEHIILMIVKAVKEENEFNESQESDNVSLQFDKDIRALFNGSSDEVDFLNDMEFSNNNL